MWSAATPYEAKIEELKVLIGRLAEELKLRQWEHDPTWDGTRPETFCQACQGGGTGKEPLKHAEGCPLKALLDEAERAVTPIR
jgi:hypothetical protein